MKIIGLKVFVAHVQRTNFVFVKIYTDEGIDGVGEATLEWKTMTIVAALEELERELIGRDPFAVDAQGKSSAHSQGQGSSSQA